jgi:transposase-like protein
MRRRPRGKTIKVCPHCGSARIVADVGLITGQRYHCLACDYVGSLILETDVEDVLPTKE